MTDEQAEMRALLEEAVRASDADEVQATFSGGRLHVARFADNRIQNSVEERWGRLGLRVAYWGLHDVWRVGDAETTEFEPKGLVRLAEAARASSELREPTADYLRMPYADDFESSLADMAGAWDAHTATAGPALVADTIAALTLPALRRGWRCDGHLALGVGTLLPDGEAQLAALANINDLFHYYKPTRVTVQARIASPAGGLGTVDRETNALGVLGLDRAVEAALRDAELPARPGSVDAGPVRVLLEAPAVSHLLELLRPHFEASHVLLDTSPFAMRFETPVFGPAIDVSLDPGHPLLLGRPFDEEGWPRRELPVIEGGVLTRLLIPRARARATRVPPMGYTEYQDGVAVAVPRHPVLAGGEHDREALLAALGDGLVVGRLASAELIPPNTFRVTAITGDDVYRVRGGRPQALVGSLRLVGELDRLLGEAVVLGEQQRTWPTVAPPLVADGFEVVG